jgi:hypothetical protein
MPTCTQELAELICKHLDIGLEEFFERREVIADPNAATGLLATRRRPGRRGGRRAKPPRNNSGGSAIAA